MTDSNLFSTDFTIDPEKNYLEDLVGEGKKFKDERELARAKVESDAFIQKLQAETKGLREDLNKRASIEDFLDQMKSMNEPQHREPEPANHAETDDEQRQSGPSTGATSLAQEDLEKLIEQKVSQREKERSAQENLNLVRSEMQKAWGEEYSSRLVSKAKELGLGEEFLNSLAKSQPKAFLKLVDAQQQERKPDLFNPRNTSVDSAKFGMSNTNEGDTYSHYEKMRREDPKKYWDPKTQNQIWKLAKENPEKFFDT